MKTLINPVLFAATAMVLGTAAYGQTVVMRAEIPFAFRTANGTLAAGEYTVTRMSTRGAANIVSLRNAVSNDSGFVMGGPNEYSDKGTPSMVFRCDSDGCALSAIRSSRGTVSYSSGRKTSRAREVAVIAVPLRAVNGD